jgi:nucleoside-diphosphate-sugar epimerase
MKLQDKSLLITGIGGFIGFRTAELALQRGMRVRGLQHSLPKAQKARELGRTLFWEVLPTQWRLRKPAEMLISFYIP